MTIDPMPNGWKVLKLGEVGRWGSGGTPKRGVAKYFGGDIPWVKSGDLDDGVVTRVEEYITEDGLSSSSAKLIDPGTLLIAMYGATIGKLGVPAMRCATNQAIAFCVPDPSIATTDYLFELLLHMRPELVALGKGGAQPNISQTVLKVLEIPVPPLDVQAALVHALRHIRVNSASTTDHLETAARVIGRFRRAVLAAACSGRLTVDWRESNQSEAVSQHLRDRRGEVEALVETPEEWAWCQLVDIADLKGGIQKGAAIKAGMQTREVPYLRVANVQRGWLDLSEIKTIVAPEAKIKELRLEPGDILFNEGGDRDKLGRGWIWEGQIDECIHQNHVFRARLQFSDFEPRFFSWYGNTIGAAYFIDRGKQTVNLASLNMTTLKALPVPIPSPAEQREIVQRAQRLLTLADGLATRIDAAARQVDRSSQAVLAKAFRGELSTTSASDLAVNLGGAV
jgi:type I restriction enzyme S subunit